MGDIKVYGKIKNFTTDGELAEASQIKDTAKGKFQSQINSDLEEKINNKFRGSGENSFALGDFSTASGTNSFALGFDTTASGTNSFALGYNAIASEYSSFALGEYAKASGQNSIAIGCSTKASGTNSFALGTANASGDNSFALGTANASGHNSFILGDGQIPMRIDPVLGTIYKNSEASGENSFALGHNVETSGHNSFALGSSVTASGHNSFALGKDTTASGDNSFALGTGAIASGINSFALGTGAIASGYHSFALGNYTTASGSRSFALGELVTASGQNSIAIGTGAIASGDNSWSFGTNTTASGSNSFAFGLNSTASGLNSFAFGEYATAIGDSSWSFGTTIASGKGSFALGYSMNNSLMEYVDPVLGTIYANAIASGDNSFAFGDKVRAIGNGSHAEGHGDPSDIYWTTKVSNVQGTKFTFTSMNCSTGNSGDKLDPNNIFYAESDPKTYYFVKEITNNYIVADKNIKFSTGTQKIIYGKLGIAFGDYSHTEGASTLSCGFASHAEGDCGHAMGRASHAEGYYGYANGEYSHVEGDTTKANGKGSHAEGWKTVAEGDNSHAEGSYTTTTNKAEHAEGMANLSTKGKTISSIGIGVISEDNTVKSRKNAVEVHNNGNIYIKGIGGYDGTNPTTENTLQKAIKDLIPITYSALKALRDGSTLEAGKYYRITDYVTTTVQEKTKSANHPFDVIVLATDVNALSEQALAIQHEGDLYFKDCNLAAWRLWYDLDNDNTKYAWADTANGKGVIYRMIDEHNNDCPYDFKNILMYCDKYTLNQTPDNYYYTFSYNVKGVLYDGSAEKQVTECYGNVMKKYVTSNKHSINFNIFLNSSFWDHCQYNTFGNHCSSNTFGNDCSFNEFRNSCYSNTFGNDCSFNEFRDGCSSNTFEDYCRSNKFGNYCSSNTFVNDCSSNTFEDYCYSNTFGDNLANRQFSSSNTILQGSEQYYDDGSGQVVPVRYPDLSTQPSILPYKLGGRYVYEQVLTKLEAFPLPEKSILLNVYGSYIDSNKNRKMINLSEVYVDEANNLHFPSQTGASDVYIVIQYFIKAEEGYYGYGY